MGLIENNLGLTRQMPPLLAFEVFMKWIITYVWILSLMGAIFCGHEIARIVHKMDKEHFELVANEKIKNCNEMVARFEQ